VTCRCPLSSLAVCAGDVAGLVLACLGLGLVVSEMMKGTFFSYYFFSSSPFALPIIYTNLAYCLEPAGHKDNCAEILQTLIGISCSTSNMLVIAPVVIELYLPNPTHEAKVHHSQVNLVRTVGTVLYCILRQSSALTERRWMSRLAVNYKCMPDCTFLQGRPSASARNLADTAYKH
jgi:hypothetical protein